MDIDIDLEKLASIKMVTSKCKEKFGDVNLQMINMINVAGMTLSGNQFEIAKAETKKTIYEIKNVIGNLECTERYIDCLNEVLNEYLKYKFKEGSI